MHERSKHGVDIAVECWRLDAEHRSAVFASFDGGVPALVHVGRKLPDGENLETLARLTLPSVGGGQLDPVVPLTLLPTAMEGWQGHPGIEGMLTCPVTLDSAERSGTALTFAIGGEFPCNITAQISEMAGILSISVGASSPQRALSPGIPVPDHMPRIIDHSGRWCGEFRRQERRFTTGQHVRESREGRTGHAHFPGMIFAADACGENIGECMAVSLAWSGGHRLVAEEIPDGRRHVQLAVLDDHEGKVSTDIHVVWSDAGFNGLSQALHELPRVFSSEKLKDRKVARPVHYNCWEAVYFRHSVDELKEIATRAAELGAERFVLDDGWFKGRNDDTTSLGDWTVDRQKYPDGLHPLIEHIRSQGMQFGIWFEPEMVNTDSDLYRAHPDWVLGPDAQQSGRGQFVLDLSNGEVTDYLFNAIAAILAEHPADYIKWDHNRILTCGTAAQSSALYGLLDRLNQAFPDVEIETCSSGGGRIDYGILQRTTRVWLSDSNDALERMRMQHEASRWLPPEIQGSHVGPRICHTSGRILSIGLRAWVAAQRHMGFEMDPRELTENEATELMRVTSWYRDNRDFLFSAMHYRLEGNDEQVFAEMFVDDDSDRFVLFKGQAGPSDQIAARSLAFAGLDPNRMYGFQLINPEVVPRTLNQNSATGFLNGESLTMSGAALMAGALRLPNAFPATMMVLQGKAVSREPTRRST